MRALARRTVILAALVALASCGKKAATDLSADMSQGSPTAPVTVIEYASPTCPHCISWNEEVFPAFKTKYVDTGKVRYVFREAPIHGQPDFATYMLARCAGKDRYFQVVDAVMASFPEVSSTGDMGSVLRRIGASLGMSEQQVQTCLTDEKALLAMNTRTEKQMKEFAVDQTPTFIIQGKKADWNAPPTMEQLTAAIEPLLKK